MRVHAFSNQRSIYRKRVKHWAIRSITYPKPEFNIYNRQTFILVKTPFLKKKTKQLDSFASICIFKAKVCSVCSYHGKSNQAIKLQRCMRLPGSNFQGLEKKKRLAVNSQTLFSFFSPFQAY